MDLSAFDLKGKVALITGGAHGIGFSIAEGMAKCGAAICFNCSSEASLEKGMAAYKAAGIEAHGYVADVSDEDAVNAMVAKIKAEVGPVDILVNNAGLTLIMEQMLMILPSCFSIMSGRTALEQLNAPPTWTPRKRYGGLPRRRGRGEYARAISPGAGAYHTPAYPVKIVFEDILLIKTSPMTAPAIVIRFPSVLNTEMIL